MKHKLIFANSMYSCNKYKLLEKGSNLFDKIKAHNGVQRKESDYVLLNE